MPASRRQATSQESRRILIDAAAELFAEKGYRATTFEDVAQRAGISRGSIPWHFGNKEGLLQAVMDDFRATAVIAAANAASFDDALDQVFDYIRRPASRLLITLLGEAVEPGSPLAECYIDLQITMRKWLADCMAGVVLPPGVDQHTFITVVHGCVIGVHQQWRVTPQDIDLDAAKAAIKELFAPEKKPRQPSHR